MALTLQYGNPLPRRAAIVLGKRIRTTELQQLVRVQHELWSESHETFGGLVMPALVTPITTTSTTFNAGVGGLLYTWQPFLRVQSGLLANQDRARLKWAAFVTNAEIQVEALTSGYVVRGTDTEAAVDGTPQWIRGELVVTGLTADPILGLRVSIRRLGFDTSAQLRHVAARLTGRLGSDIPT